MKSKGSSSLIPIKYETLVNQGFRRFVIGRMRTIPLGDVSLRSGGGCPVACDSFKVQGNGRSRRRGKAQ